MDSDIMSMVGAVTSMRQAQVSSVLQTRLLKMDLDSQSKAAVNLINTIPALNPAHLGQNIDIKA